jgi:hypothetical protein
MENYKHLQSRSKHYAGVDCEGLGSLKNDGKRGEGILLEERARVNRRISDCAGSLKAALFDD